MRAKSASASSPHQVEKAAPHENLPHKLLPLPNYTLATVCPACDTPTFRLACKVRCPRCGFMWDCSEL